MTDRDTFAAAALTGLLSNVQRYQNEPLTRQAYEIADFMLREQVRDSRTANTTTYDAATPPQGSVPDSGNWKEPVAWGVVHANGFGGVVDCYTSQQWCKHHFPGPHFRYVPLYLHPQPTLDDEEREAVEHFAATFKGPMALKLRKLLERLK